MSNQEKIKNRLSAKQSYELCQWCKENITVATSRDHASKLATISLGFKVTYANIAKAEEVIGMQFPILRTSKKYNETDVTIAKSVVLLMNSLGYPVPGELAEIATGGKQP